MTDLERRAEELIKELRGDVKHNDDIWLNADKAAQVIEQLLSENRQVRAENEHANHLLKNAMHRESEQVVRAEAAEARVRELEEAHPTENTNHARHHEALAAWMDDWAVAQSTIAQLKEDLDRSAEREAYREALWHYATEGSFGLSRDTAQELLEHESAHRILAENDR